MLGELGERDHCGEKVGFDVLTGSDARTPAPVLTDRVTSVVRLDDQRFIDPPRPLADAVRSRGAAITDSKVLGSRRRTRHVGIVLGPPSVH
ncbi:hypothetical protein [Pseudonocardia oroxyli]|uniref:D-amino-acid dehydrogenase n=1 Tax=Pseudonocardia oroxyli TaxID=366584 RepID=A0A1G7E7G2_PSEOR|nr:hypothetical protein [Pseudonocardia oroxyli]SDE59426.1 D-amino-acid dehydrogenase [Pseudonocardia oroxyli]